MLDYTRIAIAGLSLVLNFGIAVRPERSFQ